ncbi:hypothetical protein B4N89_25990 [Embleya scabrispora]|uniref:Uncharacterized protein n=1 Tax=Embleya scabrispora TaxID=159449 RepID=A0A1T3P4Q5_9ACTN|nr:hypothetical protein B4N89_25990 [Embleya scabrispora]
MAGPLGSSVPTAAQTTGLRETLRASGSFGLSLPVSSRSAKKVMIPAMVTATAVAAASSLVRIGWTRLFV